MSDNNTIADVLSFWFGDPPYEPRMKRWWQGGPELDREIESRFGPLVEAALAGELTEWESSPQGRLALILLLDQFTRNIHRGDARAFAGDERALHLATEGLEQGIDRELHPLQRAFFYMPLEHAESLPMQDRAVAEFERLVEEAPDSLRKPLKGNVDYAHQHREIIQQFGRFPHRNEVLGRESTAAEAAYLAEGGRRFGQ